MTNRINNGNLVILSPFALMAYFFIRYFIGGMFLLYGISSAVSIVAYLFMALTGQLPFSALLYNLIVKIGCVLLYGTIGYKCYEPVFAKYGLFGVRS